MKSTPSKNGDGAPTSRLTGEARGNLERKILDGVKGTARLVLHELFGFFQGKAVCWPGNDAVAKAAGVSACTVSRALKALESDGVILTVDDSSVRSRRRIVLLGHDDANAELARLEMSPHVKFDRCRIGRPHSDNCRGTLSNCKPEPTQNDNPEVIKLISETVEPLSAELESPNSRERTEGENSLPNGERKIKPPKAASVPLSAHQLRVKAMAEGGDRASQAEWEVMRRALMMTTEPDEQIIADVMGGAPTGPVEFLERLGPGAPDSVCNRAVEVLCKILGATDARDYRRAYQKAVNQVRNGVLSVAVFMHAVRQALHPSARNPGRVFGHNIENRKGVQP